MTGNVKTGGAAAAVVLAAAVVFLVVRAQALPAGVQPIVWDKEACGECAMAVSEPRFAAQLQRRDGVVLNFDDPGCLFQYLATHDPEIHALYFHHHAGDDWLDRDHVGFAPAKGSPMGHDLGAVARDAPGAISFDQAMEQVRRQTGEDHR